MGLIKDVLEYNEGYVWYRKAVYFFSPTAWLRCHKWRKQRADRGWADRDAWAAGEHIARITSEILTYLDTHSYIDWEEWFKDNGGKYTSISDLTTDINNYLDFIETSWADGLTLESTDIKATVLGENRWLRNGKPLTDKQITMLIHKQQREEVRLFNKASKAMQFFSKNFDSFWD